VPPANIPIVRRGGDPLVTGSVGGELKSPGKVGNALMSPDSIAHQKDIPAEPASVFNLPRAKAGED
jgi:hypothetical protein